MRPGVDVARRVGVLLLALALGSAAIAVSERDGVPALPGLDGWIARHPDPRDLGEAGLAVHADERARARQVDAELMLAALAAAACALALLPRRQGSGLLALALGSACVGVFVAATSVREQSGRAEVGAWTLGDDALVGVAGAYTEALRAIRAQVPDDACVLVVGTQDWLLNVVAWTLFPRLVVPVVVPVPPGWTSAQVAEAAAALPHGQDASARFVIDLAALAAGPDATRPALQELPR